LGCKAKAEVVGFKAKAKNFGLKAKAKPNIPVLSKQLSKKN